MNASGGPSWAVIVEALPVPAWIGDAQGEVRYTNAAWRRARPDVEGLAATEQEVRSGLRAAALQLGEGPVTAARGTQAERAVPTPGQWQEAGGRTWMETVGRVAGSGGLLLGVLTDITLLRQQARHATDQDARKGIFMNEAAHELRNPLTPVLMQLQLLLAAPDLPPERRERSLLVALRGAQRVDTLLADILEVTRLHGGKRPLARVRLDLVDAARQAVDSVQGEAGPAGITVELEQASAMPVEGDPVRLARALAHLVRNGVQACREGQRVRVRAWPEHGRANVRVTDEGIGLDESQLGGLRAPFAKVHADPERRQRSGLGLTFTRDVLEALGGGLEGTSGGPGRGATFTAWLPLAPP